MPAKQWPANNSISMTLSNCYTTTKVEVVESLDEHKFIFMGYFNSLDFVNSFTKIICFSTSPISLFNKL